MSIPSRSATSLAGSSLAEAYAVAEMLKLNKIVSTRKRLFEMESGMPRGGKDETAKAADVAPVRKTADDNETFGEVLSRAGFESAQVGRKFVSQGKRRETLKRRASENAEK
jgi:hypothetical protein